MIFIRKKVDVPETDIQEVIKLVADWLAANPEKPHCMPAIFGHPIWTVHRNSIEADVRAAASQAYPYHKA